MKNFVRKSVREMPGYVPGEQPQAGKFIKLNTNECPYPPSEAIWEAAREAISVLNRYPDPMANRFRRAAAEVLGVPAEWIMAGNGSDDLLTILTRTFVGENETLRLPYPSYILYKSLAQLQGAKSEEVLFDENWQLTAGFAQNTPGLKLVYLPNPNSPSGTMISREEIIRLASELPCPLVVDEAYADFAPFHCVDLVEKHPKIIVSRTFSKSYALAGVRFGFLVAHPDLIAEFVKVKDSYNCDALSIAVAAAAIQDRTWFQETRAKILKTRIFMETELQKLGFRVTPSEANFVWCTREDRPVKPIYEALKAENIFVRYMAYDRWRPKDGLRISVGTDAEIAVLLEKMKNVL